MAYHILVVDDNDMNLVLLSKILEMEGYQVTTAQDAMEALKLVEQKKPDLAILDVMMPDMNGYELCRNIRLLPFGKELPIVMLTAMSSDRERTQALEAGANDIWTKPFEMNLFRQRVGELIKKAQ
jgi:CheY-like chemotaxis protein